MRSRRRHSMSLLISAILFNCAAQARVATTSAFSRDVAMIERREQFLTRMADGARHNPSQLPTPQMPLQVLQRREILARMAATAGAVGIEGGIPQVVNAASRWALGSVAAPAMRAKKVVERGKRAYNTYKVMASKPVDNYVGLQPPGTFTQGLSLFVQSSVCLFLVAAVLIFFAHVFLCVVAVLYFAMLRVRRGFFAAVELMDSFVQEQGVLARLSALNLSISPIDVKTGPLRETLLSTGAPLAKVGALLSPTAVPRVSKSLPARAFQEP